MTKKLSALLLLVSFLINFGLHSNKLNREIQGVHSWRQSQTMWNIRNFVRHDNNILNPRVSNLNGTVGGKTHVGGKLYRYEFPIMQWCAAQLQRTFGEHIVVVRLFILLIALFGAFGMYLLALLVFKDHFVALAVGLLYQFSTVVYYYSINPLPDVLALSAGIWYLYFIIKYRESRRSSDLVWSSLFLTLSVAAKLPYLILAAPSAYFFLRDLFSKRFNSAAKLALIHLVFLAPTFYWYAWVIPTWTGNPVVSSLWSEGLFTRRTFRILAYHLYKMFPILLLYPVVWLFFFFGVKAFFEQRQNFLWILALVASTMFYWLLEFHPIGKVHDYYMMPFLPWLYLVVGFGVQAVRNRSWKYAKQITTFLLVLAPFYTALVTEQRWSVKRTSFNPDVINNREALKKAVPDDALCIVLKDTSNYIFTYNIDKMGFVFNTDDFPVSWMDDMIHNQEAEYLYSDSRKFDERTDIQPYLNEMILEVGSVRVFRLENANAAK